MKKIIIRIVIPLIVLLVLGVLALGLFLDKAIKSGIETFGPKFTKTDVTLQSVGLSLLSGSGSMCLCFASSRTVFPLGSMI